MKRIYLFTAVLLVCLVANASTTNSRPQSLAFVVDQSMPDMFTNLKTEVTKYVYQPDIFRYHNFDHFVLVTFSDKNSSNVGFESFSLRDFQSVITQQSKFAAKGNSTSADSCAAYGFDGLWKAVNLSYPNSFVFYFTDGAAKDSDQMAAVIMAAYRKHIRIWIIATGCCSVTCSRYATYMTIAKLSSGVFYSVHDEDLKTVIAYITQNIKCRSLNNLYNPPKNFAILHGRVAMDKACPPAFPPTTLPPKPRPTTVVLSSAQRQTVTVFTVVMGTISSLLLLS